jgi:hypothetical protein
LDQEPDVLEAFRKYLGEHDDWAEFNLIETRSSYVPTEADRKSSIDADVRAVVHMGFET